MSLMIPSEILKAGDNEIAISNVTPDTPSRSARFTDPEEAKSDSQWGWVQISELIVSDPVGSFEAFARGEKNSLWRQDNGGLKAAPGKITAGEGKVSFTSGAAPLLVLSGSRPVLKNPRIPVNPGATVRLTIEATGTGKAQLRLQTYPPYKTDPKTKAQRIDRSGYNGCGNHYKTYRSPEFELSETPQTFTCDFKVWKAVGVVYPEIVLSGPGLMTVTKFRFEELPAEKR